MNNLNKFLLIFFIYLTSINVTNSQETAFIDIDYIMENSNIGKKVLENINKLDKEILKVSKKIGFSDETIASLTNNNIEEIRNLRKKWSIIVMIK